MGEMIESRIFKLDDANRFIDLALEIFHFQSVNNTEYAAYLKFLNIETKKVSSIDQIPFLPIEFFKSKKILSSNNRVEQTFVSSGTTGAEPSKHYVTDLEIYRKSFSYGFEQFYGDVEDYIILALLPSYLERKGSSLIYMVDHLIISGKVKESGFYLNNLEELSEKLIQLDAGNKKVLLLGVSYALLDLLSFQKFHLKNTIVMETGGMKGKRKEMIREELHHILCEGFGIKKIHSEYGMTELLSQAYSYGQGIFRTPPWMRVLIRDSEDAMSILPINKTGGINIIDLANINSCSFIATQDLGKIHTDGSFEIMGRFDTSDIRGCNLMVV